MTPFRLALLNLWRRKHTSLIAILALALPVAIAGNLHRLQLLANERFSQLDQSPGIVIGAKSGEVELLLNSLHGEGELPDFFTANLYQSLNSRFLAHQPKDKIDADHRSLLEHSIGILLFAKWQDARVMGTTDSFWQRPSAANPPVFLAGRAPNNLGEIVIGSQVASKEGLAIGDKISLTPWVSRDDALNQKIKGAKVEVVGIMAPTELFWDKQLYTTLAQAQISLGAALPYGALHPVWKENVLHFILAYDRPGAFESLNHLVNYATVAQAISVPNQVEKLYELTGTRQTLGFVVSALTLLLGTLAIAGIMITRFDFMRAQLNVLRAIGYQRREVALWLLSEGLILGAIAIVIGGSLDFFLLSSTAQLAGLGAIAQSVESIPLIRSAPVWLTILLAAVLAAALPLARLYKQSVHQQLRGL